MNNIDSLIEKLEKYISIGTMIVMLLLTFVNVISRFIFHMSLAFTEEIVTGLFVLASLIGSSIAIKTKSHMGLNIITENLPQVPKRILAIISDIFSISFCSILLVYGILMVQEEFHAGQVTAGMQWPEWIFGLTVPVGTVFVLLRFILVFIKHITSKEEI